MNISAKYNEDGSISAVIGALSVTIPDDDKNRHRNIIATWEGEGNTISPFVALPPSEVDIRTESSRRLRAIFGARDEIHLTILISDALRESTKLLRIGENNWTDDQKARDYVLNQSNDLVDAFDAASKNLRAMPEIPIDFAEDKYWPAFPNAT